MSHRRMWPWIMHIVVVIILKSQVVSSSLSVIILVITVIDYEVCKVFFFLSKK